MDQLLPQPPDVGRASTHLCVDVPREKSWVNQQGDSVSGPIEQFLQMGSRGPPKISGCTQDADNIFNDSSVFICTVTTYIEPPRPGRAPSLGVTGDVDVELTLECFQHPTDSDKLRVCISNKSRVRYNKPDLRAIMDTVAAWLLN